MQMNLLITTEMVAEEGSAAVPRTPSLGPVWFQLKLWSSLGFPQKTSVHRPREINSMFSERDERF